MSSGSDIEPTTAPCGPVRVLGVQVEQLAGAAVMTLRGTAGILEAQQIRPWLDQLVSRRLPQIVVDLHAMDRVGAMAVAAVVGSYASQHRRRSRISLVFGRGLSPEASAGEHSVEILAAS